MYAVILAGGGGTRLHPLSRPERPKPFLPLLGDRSLLQGTVDRVAGVADRITVVTDARYREIVEEQTPAVDVLVEPMGRNTAAAIALATIAIDRPEDEVIVVLPADQTVEDSEVFRGVLRAAGDHLATGAFGIDDPLVTLGIQVDRPATEYGYLIPDLGRGADVGGARPIREYPLTRFEE
jgi:mannose-1-phosphate guanylyltransferase